MFTIDPVNDELAQRQLHRSVEHQHIKKGEAVPRPFSIVPNARFMR